MSPRRGPRDRQDWERVAESLRLQMPQSQVRSDAPLGALSTYRVGGRAAVLVEVGSVADLLRLASVTAAEPWEVLVVGLGSNLLVSDGGFDGLALRLGAALGNVRLDAGTVVAGAATPLPILARRCAAAGLGGFSWAVGVPGSVGGAVRMNAGGHGSDMSQVVRRADIVDLAAAQRWKAELGELGLEYRSSSIRPHHVVVEVELLLRQSDRQHEEALIREIVAWRRRNQPGGANTGSVFKNPPDDAAGRLVEAAGCKGLRVGSAMVSTQHANFIRADPDGSAEDVMSLMREVARRVRSHSGVRLCPETRLIGFDAPFGSGA